MNLLRPHLHYAQCILFIAISAEIINFMKSPFLCKNKDNIYGVTLMVGHN